MQILTGSKREITLMQWNEQLEKAKTAWLVWDGQRKSLLIHSMLTGYPIPAFYASKCGNYYDMLDGNNVQMPSWTLSAVNLSWKASQR